MAVVTDADGAAQLPADLGVPVLTHADPRSVAGLIADVVYGRPSDGLTTVGITGTNGKTTTAYFVEAALRAGLGTSALMGTVELRIGDQGVESPRTTVEAPALHRLMAVALERGVTNLTTEVSSHAIALKRLAGVRFDVVAFTNLQRDHLDFHGTMESYFETKASLFRPEQATRGVVVVDDAWGRRLARTSPIPVESVATHIDAPGAEDADWQVVGADIGLDGVGSTFQLRGPDGTVHTAHSPLPGLVNVSNATTAIVVAVAAGVPIDVAIEAVGAARAIPGRMERVVERGEGLPLCIVDYAHTPDALVYALEAVRPITPGRLAIVLGSDGDRDQGKRPMLGAIAARLADLVVVTDENPRSEVPGDIRAAILAGAREVRPDLTDVVEIAEGRAAALAHAMGVTGEGDTVIVTGKGHEPTQEIAGVFHRYNDRDVYLAQAEKLRGRADDRAARRRGRGDGRGSGARSGRDPRHGRRRHRLARDRAGVAVRRHPR
ncbi:Mur ligase family protein [Serinibacter arcticus]|uniref:Mur ligase family protein n=1 Tax=Serinibacter arcticus TaxID=1655435 RepID=UPI001F3D6AD4|nr:UDP-N-acetylmuramoyl-L-alanyl-D-glutamate--2,6-diaminopimelate ligase [Serinibacter arcticus]